MPVLNDAVHDFAHPVEDDLAWGESYFFFAFDPAADIGIHCGIRVRPNEGEMQGSLFLSLPGGDVAEMRATREQHEMIDTDLEVGGLQLIRDEPMRRWSVQANSEMARLDPAGALRGTYPGSVSLHYESITPAIGTDGQRNKPVSDLNLSVRARKCMNRLGINTLGELVQRTADELLESKNFGMTSLTEVREKLRQFGLTLRGD